MQKEFTLGYFLKLRHIVAAVKLLKKQLVQSSPLYNTIDFKIYRERKSLDAFPSKDFYEKYVKNDAFYYFENLFFIKEFVSPQGAYKIRKYHFLSFELLIIFYAVGFYIHELLSRYQSDIDLIFSKKDIKVYYGGKINHKEPEKSNIYYHEDYNQFVEKKEEISSPEKGYIKYVLTLDIKSFFYTISHKILFQTISSKASDYDKRRLVYDDDTISSLEFLFKYLIRNNEGIPVSSQNIVANYLSSVYFADFDEFVSDELIKEYNLKYIRYVDDFYIVIKVKDDEDTSVVRSRLYDIENKVSEFLSTKLGLSISPGKSKRVEIKDTESHKEFLEKFKSVSLFPGETAYIVDDTRVQVKSKKDKGNNEDVKSAPEIFNECVDLIKSIKKQLAKPFKIELDSKASNYLNNILINEACLNYSKSKKTIGKIEEEKLFLDYSSVDYILLKPKVFLHLITVSAKNRDYLIKTLKNNIKNGNSTDQTLVLVEKLLLHLEFLNKQKKPIINDTYLKTVGKDFLKLLIDTNKRGKPSNYLQLLISMLDKDKDLVKFKPLYSPEFLNQGENIALIQQIKQRRLNEEINYYNVAFNHFLNEFQHLYEIAFFNRGKVTSLDIKNSMIEQSFRTNEVTLVSDFFNRRNQNSISHTNDIDIGFWGVSSTDYEKYKNKVYPILEAVYFSPLEADS